MLLHAALRGSSLQQSSKITDMTPQELETSLKKGNIPVICYLFGEESFLVDRAVERLLDHAIDPSLKDFNFNVFYGAESKGIDIVDAAQTLPMFADRRAVLVKRAEALKAEALEILLPYIQNPSQTTCLIFSSSKIDQRKKFFLELKKRGALVEYKKLYENKLVDFIQNECRAQGKQIEQAAAGLLSALIGNNLQELSSQIEKLVVFTGSKNSISVDDVKAVSSSSKAFTAFELGKYAGLKDLANALKSLEGLFRDGEQAPMIVGALARHFKQLWRVRELMDRKVPQNEIGKDAGINPFYLQDMIQQAKNFQTSDLFRILKDLHECDIASKSGGRPYVLLHSLIMNICS